MTSLRFGRGRALLLAPALAAFLLSACNLDVQSPNTPREEDVLETREGVLFLAVGLQADYGNALDDFIYPAGLITDELGATLLALISYKDTEIGDLDATYDAVQAPWITHYGTIRFATRVVAAAQSFPQDPIALDSATKNGVIALGYLIKAMSYGELLQMYQQIIIDPTNSAAPFVGRTQSVPYVLALLDSAAATLRARAPGATFTNTILARGVDLRSTIFAMKARYQRIAKNDAAALAATDSVNLATVSAIPYAGTVNSRNPINSLSRGLNYVKPRDQFRLAVDSFDLADKRDSFFVTVAAVETNRVPLDEYRVFASQGAPLPIYYPGEVLLIRAEALTNLGRFAEAAAAVNAVRTKCNTPSTIDPEACSTALPITALDTREELLAEIYRQRRFELYSTGLRWEDLRRLGQVGRGLPAQRCWLLYPDRERQTNPNVPNDPEPPDAEPGPKNCGV